MLNHHTNVQAKISMKSLDLVELISSLVVSQEGSSDAKVKNTQEFCELLNFFWSTRVRMNFLGASGNSSVTVIHCRTASLVQRNAPTAVLNL